MHEQSAIETTPSWKQIIRKVLGRSATSAEPLSPSEQRNQAIQDLKDQHPEL